MDAETKAELQVATERLQRFAKEFPRATRAALGRAGRIVRDEIRDRTPESKKPHSRYSTPKAFNALRAPKGTGRIVKTYQPGNLKNSIDVLSFRRSEAVFVGPRMGRRSVGFDGYYAGWIEKGTKHIKPWHFIRDGAAASGPWALERIEKDLARIVQRHNSQA